MTNIDLSTLPAPSLLRRLAAMFYDTWLVLATLCCTVFLLILLRGSIEGSESMPQGKIALSGYWRYPTFAILFFMTGLFFAYFWKANGQTLGMQTWRIKVVNLDNSDVNFSHACIRFLAACLSFATLGLGYLWVLANKEKMSLHDKLSGTKLLLLPKKEKNKK